MGEKKVWAQLEKRRVINLGDVPRWEKWDIYPFRELVTKDGKGEL